MFRTRISFSFARLFRLRIRCSAKGNVSSQASRPCKSSTSQHGPIDALTTAPRSLSAHSSIRDIPAQDSTTSTVSVIIIGGEQDTIQTIPTLCDDDGSQIHLDSLSHVESPLVDTRHASLQAPPTHTDGSAVTESPGKLVAHPVEVDTETGTITPPEITITSPTPAPDCDSVAEVTPRSSLTVATESDAELNVPCLGSAKARHRSLFVPQLVQSDKVRFSMPANPATPRATIRTEHAGQSRRQNKHTSFLPIGVGTGTPWREKRSSRWSREMSKRETQEVLKALSAI